MWFGANTSGLDNRDTLTLIARHRVAGYGWQQGTGTLNPGEDLGRGEVYGAEAATHLTDYLSLTGGANRTLVFVYRQVTGVLQLVEKCGFWICSHDISRRLHALSSSMPCPAPRRATQLTRPSGFHPHPAAAAPASSRTPGARRTPTTTSRSRVGCRT